MPALANVKHEAFAQHLASGMKALEAYEKAGYVPNAASSAVLARSDEIRLRVAEIKSLVIQRQNALIDAGMDQQVAHVIREDSALVTKSYIQRELIDILGLAKGADDFGIAVKTIELLGRTIGLFEKANPNSVPLNNPYSVPRPPARPSILSLQPNSQAMISSPTPLADDPLQAHSVDAEPLDARFETDRPMNERPAYQEVEDYDADEDSDIPGENEMEEIDSLVPAPARSAGKMSDFGE